MDHFIKEKLGCRYYLRYMDDFVVFHQDKKLLLSVKEEITTYLEGIKLFLHKDKCRVYRTADGVPFLGLVIFPHRRRLKREAVIRIPWPHIHQSIQSWPKSAVPRLSLVVPKEMSVMGGIFSLSV